MRIGLQWPINNVNYGLYTQYKYFRFVMQHASRLPLPRQCARAVTTLDNSGCFAYIGPLPTALSNGQNPLGMSNTNAVNNCEVRSTKIGPCATRALPRALGNMALNVVKMGT
jgi:hypothetical protein